MSTSPYSNLPASAFWRTGVGGSHPLEPSSLYRKAFDIDASDRISTAGSCFAQHISRAMRKVGYQVQDREPSPTGLPTQLSKNHGYGLYSARYSNIYTPRQLVQLLSEAFENVQSPDPVWMKDGRYYDSMRPAVEPEGLVSADEVILHREEHLKNVRELIESTDVFIFTLGLTECWRLSGTDWVFPTAPGTIAGEFDADMYEFHNFTYGEIIADMYKAIELVERYSTSTRLRFLFTVSPVPLTATCSADHVLLATTYSKSVLRAVVGELCSKDSRIGYFPSYEMVTAPWSRGVFYDANLRTVNQAGVDIIMRSFLHHHALDPQLPQVEVVTPIGLAPEEPACEEAMLDAFATP